MSHKYDWTKKDLLLALKLRNEGKTWKEIAIHFGRTNYDSARFALIYHKMIVPPRRKKRKSLNEVIPLRNAEGWSDVRIAKEYGYHPTSVSEARRKLGISRIPIDRVALGRHRYRVVTKAYGVKHLSDIANEKIRIEASYEGFYGVEGIGQLKLMRWLWEHGPATAKEIGQAMGYSLHRSSCRTAVRKLRFLAKCGLVTSERIRREDGKIPFVYTAHKIWVSE